MVIARLCCSPVVPTPHSDTLWVASLVLPNFTEATLVEITRDPPQYSSMKSAKDFATFWQDMVTLNYPILFSKPLGLR